MQFSFTKYRILCYCLIFIISCKTATTTKEKSLQNNTKSDVTNATQSVYPTEPGTCIVQGYIISVVAIDKSIMEEPCKSFACKANVIITKASACGFGVHQKPVAGDTLLVNFIHSLASSQEFNEVYPAKVSLPGLKQDQLFEAQIRIKLLPMDKLTYEIGNYELVR
jgi:hypothetical protein